MAICDNCGASDAQGEYNRMAEESARDYYDSLDKRKEEDEQRVLQEELRWLRFLVTSLDPCLGPAREDIMESIRSDYELRVANGDL